MLDVSVIIPAYNVDKWISRAIESVLNQSLRPLEIIIVDDGSTDSTSRVCKSYGNRIHYIYQRNAGAAAARNTGIAEAKGEWVAFLDADDEWMPNKLAEQYKLILKYKEIIWCASSFYIYRSGRLRGISGMGVSPREDLIDSYAFLASGRWIWTGTVMVRRDILERLGGMDTSLKSSEDIDLWLRLARLQRNLAYINKPLAKYHVRVKGSLTSDVILREDLSLCGLVHKHISDINMLNSDAQKYLKNFLRKRLIDFANHAIYRGYGNKAKEILQYLERLGLGNISPEIRFRLFVPSQLWKLLWQLRKTVAEIIYHENL